MPAWRKWTSTVLANGVPVPNVRVWVFQEGTTIPIPIYEDKGVTPITQPILTDAHGRYSFFADADLYPTFRIYLEKEGYDFSAVNEDLDGITFPGARGEPGPPGPRGLVWRGPWNPTVAYVENDAVEYEGSAYICILAHTNQPPPNPTYWNLLASKGVQGPPGSPGLVWRGPWDPTVAYVEKDVVEYQGSAYVCILAHTNQPPPNPTYWNLLASKGDQGPPGPRGLVWRGPWNPTIAYVENDVVEYQGSAYVCILAHTNQPPPNPTYWNLLASKGDQGPPGPRGLVWRGAWSSTTEYAVHDAVSHGGTAYVCILPHVNKEPPNPTYWDVLAGGPQTPWVSDTNADGYGLLDLGKLDFSAASLVVIQAGAITVTQTLHRVDTEAGAASDELDIINGGSDGFTVRLRAEHPDRTVILKHGTGNLLLGGSDIILDNTDKWVELCYDGLLGKWVIVGGVGSAGGGGGLSGSGSTGKLAMWIGSTTLGNATNTDAEVAQAVSKAHDRGHPIASLADHIDWPAGVTATELGYLDGVTSPIQAQLDAKETPEGAQAKVDAHAGATTGVHGVGTARVAKTTRADQWPAWADIPDKPTTFPPSTHASSHRPGGTDALPTAAPTTVTEGATPAEGTSTAFARADHVHGTPAQWTPKPHKSTHATGGTDALSPADIGAETPSGAQAKVDAHAALTSAHGATSAATPDRIVLRDSAGRAQFAPGVANGDAVIKSQLDAVKPTAISFTIDGGGAVITTGSKGYVEVPFACTITGWTILSDVQGSIVIDVRRTTYANFPTTTSIAGSEKPTLSNARKNQDLSLTTWTTSLAAGDILEFVVESVSAVKRVNLSIRVTRA